jgi:hypothetical protein
VLTVCCFFWQDPLDRCARIYRYEPEDVAVLKSQVARNLSIPHRFVCVTDLPHLLDPSIETVPLRTETHLSGTRFAKLMLFHPDAGAALGERILYLDLDVVIVGDLGPLVDRPERLVLWRNPNFGIAKRARYNTSAILLTAGARPEFWVRFQGQRSYDKARAKTGWGGTDQMWVSYLASPDEAHWRAEDGIYGAGRLGDYHPELATTVLPENARIVAFPGRRHPKMAEVQVKHPWIEEYRW